MGAALVGVGLVGQFERSLLEKLRQPDGSLGDGRSEASAADEPEKGQVDTGSGAERISPCFTPGTMIATPKGERRVEDLKPGDRVITRDNGIQTIRWIGNTVIGQTRLRYASYLRPVLIRQGALGNGLPERDTLVSPNHRVLVSGDQTMFDTDEPEVLAAAKHLIGVRGVDVVEASNLRYIHFMCDRHEVVLSNGIWAESFHPSVEALAGMDNAQRGEIFELFPDLKTGARQKPHPLARPTAGKRLARLVS